MFCVYCGSELPNDAKFCCVCGKEVIGTVQNDSFQSPSIRSSSSKAPESIPGPDSSQRVVQPSSQPYAWQPSQSSANSAPQQGEPLPQSSQFQQPNQPASQDARAPHSNFPNAQNVSSSVKGAVGQAGQAVSEMAATSPKRLASLILAVLTGILMFTPWIGLNSQVSSLVEGAGSLMSALGVNNVSFDTSFSIPSSYSVLERIPYMDDYANAFLTLVMFPWALALIFLVVSFVVLLAGKKKRPKLLAFACFVCAAVAAWVYFIAGTNGGMSSYLEFTFWGFACLLTSIAAGIVTLVAYSKKAAA